MSTNHLPSRRSRHAAALVVCVATALSASAFGWSPTQRSQRQWAPEAGPSTLAAPATLAFTLGFDGVGAEGIDNVWRGELRTPEPGEIVLRVEHLRPEVDRAKAVWPVRAIVTVAADDPRRSFAADLDGTLDWTDGSLRMSGTVSEGWMKGAPVQQLVTLHRTAFDGAGTLSLGAVAAAR
jgi:hypothetical protein